MNRRAFATSALGIAYLSAFVACNALGPGVGPQAQSSIAVRATDESVSRAETPDPVGREFITERGPLSPEDALESFTVPPGFEVQLVASEPDLQKPMQLAFDERGRLLVSTSTNYPLGPPKDGPPSDRVLSIEIDGETGAARDIKVFADGFNICSGIESLPGGRVILGHAPDILLLTDVDGDGAVDDREVLYTGFARDDTHELPNSFTWGIDGWLYGLQGHVNSSDVQDRSGRVTPIHHGNVYRFRPDGTAIEVYARGMSNPWGLAFDNGQNLFGADCESRPLWQIVRGFPYQGFLQPTDPLGFAPHITEDSHGASGFAGLVSYSDTAFPAAYQGRLLLGNPVNGRIHLDTPHASGTTLHMMREPDLLTSTDPWFRPVDLELGPDGALYVADWYNRIIAHVEVPLDHPDRDKSRGRIWRIVYKGGERRGPMDVDWGQASWRELLRALSDPNQWIRRMAAAQLTHRFGGGSSRTYRRMLRRGESPLARMEAIWLLARIDRFTVRDWRSSQNDPDPYVRREAVRVLSEWNSIDSRTSAEALLPLLDDTSPIVAREAALALRRTPSAEGFRGLFAHAARNYGDDTLRTYALQNSMRRQLEDEGVLNAVLSDPPDGDAADRFVHVLAATEMGAAAAALTTRVLNGSVAEEDLRFVLDNIFKYGDAATVDRVLSGESKAIPTYAAALFANCDRAEKLGVAVRPQLQDWFPELARQSNPQLALEIARAYALPDGEDLAIACLTNAATPLRAREVAAETLLDADSDANGAMVLNIISDEREATSARRSMARLFARYVDSDARFETLLEELVDAPMDVFAGAVESLSTQRPGVDYLLDEVEAKRISPNHINNHITRIRIEASHRDDELTKRYKALVEGVEDNYAVVRAQIARYRGEVLGESGRDLNNGQRVFEESCVRCHRISGQGGMRGPSLDGIASRGVDRILQDILLPNWDIDPAFQTTMVWLQDGSFVDGQVVEENAATLSIVNAQDERTEVIKADIDERREVWLSPMPSDFGSIIAESDFVDLIYFLMHPPKSLKLKTAAATTGSGGP